MTDRDERSIDEISRSILETIRTVPAYRFVDRSLGDEVQVMWIGEFAQAISTLYVGYQLGQKIDEVGTALAYTIRSIGNVLNAVSDVIRRINDVIETINKAIEILSRKIDLAFMTEHLSRIETATKRSSYILTTLQGVPDADNHLGNPYVAELARQLQTEEGNLNVSVDAFARHDGTPPTLASFINCAHGIAAWSQAFTYLERYKPLAQRRGVWAHPSHQSFVQIYRDFFDSTHNNIVRMQAELSRDYLMPNLKTAVRYASGRFNQTSIPILPQYTSSDPMYKNLFSNRVGEPFHSYVTQQSSLVVNWRVATKGINSTIDEAIDWRETAFEERQRRERFMASYGPALEKRSSTLALFERPATWPIN